MNDLNLLCGLDSFTVRTGANLPSLVSELDEGQLLWSKVQQAVKAANRPPVHPALQLAIDQWESMTAFHKIYVTGLAMGLANPDLFSKIIEGHPMPVLARAQLGKAPRRLDSLDEWFEHVKFADMFDCRIHKFLDSKTFRMIEVDEWRIVINVLVDFVKWVDKQMGIAKGPDRQRISGILKKLQAASSACQAPGEKEKHWTLVLGLLKDIWTPVPARLTISLDDTDQDTVWHLVDSAGTDLMKVTALLRTQKIWSGVAMLNSARGVLQEVEGFRTPEHIDAAQELVKLSQRVSTQAAAPPKATQHPSKSIRQRRQSREPHQSAATGSQHAHNGTMSLGHADDYVVQSTTGADLTMRRARLYGLV
ncbi:hypothetical protein OIO90_004568 [Microbotryomycetes sp. JL221]|nr:hypothetical protein OIO90_004568 [Microbotryomycetes sp. JL221]